MFLIWIEIVIVLAPEHPRGQFAGVNPVDVHLEVYCADPWQAYEVLLTFDPAVGGDGGFEKLGTLADVVSVDLELEFVWSKEYRDEIIVVVETNTSISHVLVHADITKIYARMPIERATSPLQAAIEAGAAVRASTDNDWYG